MGLPDERFCLACSLLASSSPTARQANSFACAPLYRLDACAPSASRVDMILRLSRSAPKLILKPARALCEPPSPEDTEAPSSISLSDRGIPFHYEPINGDLRPVRLRVPSGRPSALAKRLRAEEWPSVFAGSCSAQPSKKSWAAETRRYRLGARGHKNSGPGRWIRDRWVSYQGSSEVVVSGTFGVY